ncbi:hypothetical protein HID58_022848, partial [Brassica napus]
LHLLKNVSLLLQLLKPASFSQPSTLPGLGRTTQTIGFPQHKKGGEFVGFKLLFLGEKDSVIHRFIPVGLANHYRPSLLASSVAKVGLKIHPIIGLGNSGYATSQKPFYRGNAMLGPFEVVYRPNSTT